MPRSGPHLVVLALGLATLGAGPSEPALTAAGNLGGNLIPAQRLLGAEPPEDVAELLEAGSLVLDRPGDLVRAYVLFERPVERVYELLSATSRQAEFRSELASLERVARTSDGQIDEHHIRIVFVELSYRLRYRLDPERRRIAWELDPEFASAMRRVEGYWELYEMDPSRTLGRFATAVDVSEALPRFLEEAITRKTLPRTLERCRRWVNADGEEP
jgi:hypothetical protein